MNGERTRSRKRRRELDGVTSSASRPRRLPSSSIPPSLYLLSSFLILPPPIFAFSPSVVVFFFLNFHLCFPAASSSSPPSSSSSLNDLPGRNRWLASAPPLDGFLPESTEEERDCGPCQSPGALGSYHATDGRRRSGRKWRRRRRRRPTAACDFREKEREQQVLQFEALVPTPTCT